MRRLRLAIVGFAAIRLYNYLVGGVVPPAGRLLTRADFVTKDNISQFYK